MYAINHATTALLIKKKNPESPILILLISVQLVEIFWVLFNYTGWEHFSILDGRLHLDYLPYSHSLFSGVLIAFISFLIINSARKNKKIAIACSIGVLSHIIIDIIFHEKDIHLSPFSDTPVWGFGIIEHPFLNFAIELVYGVFCWWYFNGNKALLTVIVVFNFIDLPMMLANGNALTPFVRYPLILPSVILFQIFITWYFVWRFSKNKIVSKQKLNP